jgi:hypothetical protein
VAAGKLSAFLTGNVTVIAMKFKWMIHKSFANMMPFFHKVFVVFNTLLPALSKTLYTKAAKLPASTHHEHITKALFHFFVIC